MRRFFLIAGAMMVLMIMPQATVWAEDTEFTPAQMKQIRKMFEDWSRQQQAPATRGQGIATPAPPSQKGSSVPTMGDTTKQSIRYGQEFSGGSGLQGGRTIYARPFVKAPKTILGGYIDFTYSKCGGGGARDCDKVGGFDQERFVPFFYSQVTDRLSVAAELEVEHGGPQGNQGDGDIKMEFATMDYRFNDAFNLRGGIILVPMGRFNLIHDSPLNDLPLRPMVSRSILPSTFAESGLGFFGTVYPSALSKIDYELYVVNGFVGDNGQWSEAAGTRKSRGSLKKDNNENKAIVSRVSFSPMLGVEVAGSVHHGTWDKKNEYDLTLWAIDGALQRGPFELMGEAAWANSEGAGFQTLVGENGCTLDTEGCKGVEVFTSDDDDSARRRIIADGSRGISYIVPENMFGYYVQLNYHFMPDGLTRAMPSYFGPNSTFTGILRWGRADTNTDSDINPNDEQRLTLGLNFRPVEDSVIKFAYTWNEKGVNDPAGSTNHNGFQFNLSSYF